MPFPYQSQGSHIESIAKKDLVQLLPKGGDLYGNTEGDLIADQTAEVKRVQKKIFNTSVIPAFDAANPKPRFDWQRAYLMNLARGGAERDGVNALFDLREPSRAASARRDLPYLGAPRRRSRHSRRWLRSAIWATRRQSRRPTFRRRES